MKKKVFVSILCILAIIAGVCIGAVCEGILAFLGSLFLAIGGAFKLIDINTDWIWIR